ncbi:hypothetical protein HOLleu_00335 [Holothuria leucospilota]|uniref:Uncharacterized protein n=1 Tax=Holothuria leucospilota TaxID=206669 RepID=A0A9Q1HIN0_HOLLE|nr:hypothetical protein HOLleu_00335 [Holothuria leucospilota]
MGKLITFVICFIGVHGNERGSHLYPLTLNEASWELQCFNVSQLKTNNARDMLANLSESVLNSLGLNEFSILWQRTGYSEDINKEILKLYFIENTYDPFYQFLSWLECLKTATGNVIDNSWKNCETFDSMLFKNILKDAGYNGLLQLELSFDAAQWKSIAEKLPIAVYSAMKGNTLSYSKTEVGEMERQVYTQIESIYGLLNATIDHEESLLVADILLEILQELHNVVNSEGFQINFRGDYFGSTSLYKVCNDDSETSLWGGESTNRKLLLPDYVSNSLTNLINALNVTSNEIFNAVRSNIYEWDTNAYDAWQPSSESVTKEVLVPTVSPAKFNRNGKAILRTSTNRETFITKRNKKEDDKVSNGKTTKEYKDDNGTRSSRISAQQSSPATTTHEAPNGQFGLILGIVIGVLGVILLVIIVTTFICKVTQQKKVTPDGE